MRGFRLVRRCFLPALQVLLAVVACTPAAYAQSASASPAGQPSDVPERRPAPDFLFGQPRAFISLRGNWMFASAGSDLYDFVTSTLTIDKKDFDTGTLDVELGIGLTSRVDVVVGLEFGSSTSPSEYRDYVDNAFQPITQTTKLRETSVTAGVKLSLTPKGRRVTRYAWIPANLTPYVGGGAGLINYRLSQDGDFVDFVDLSVFYSTFRSEGWAPSAHVFGGADLRVYRRLYLSAQVRYVWASATLQRDFVDFDPIDLGGFRVGAGARIVF